MRLNGSMSRRLPNFGRVLQGQQRRARELHLGDDRLRTATGMFVPERYMRRAQELCDAKQRRILARTLRQIEKSTHERPRGGRHILNRAAVRAHGPGVCALAQRLETYEERVTPAGILRVVDLITSGDSALYALTRGRSLGAELVMIVALL